MSFLTQWKERIILIAAIAILAGLFTWSMVSNASAKEELLEATEACDYQLDEQKKQLDELRKELTASAETCTQKIYGERKRCDGLVSTYRELIDVKEEEKTIVHDLKENKAKAYEAVYRRLGYLPDNSDSE